MSIYNTSSIGNSQNRNLNHNNKLNSLILRYDYPLFFTIENTHRIQEITFVYYSLLDIKVLYRKIDWYRLIIVRGTQIFLLYENMIVYECSR